MRRQVIRAVLVGVVAFAVGVLLTLGSHGGARDARADDLTHTTSLSVVYNYVGTDAHIVATFNSSDANDARCRITFQWFDTGQSPQEASWSEGTRSSSTEDLYHEASKAAADFPNTHVSAIFTAYDSSGVVTFTTTRTIVMP